MREPSVPLDVRPVVRGERAALLDLLRGLSPAAWDAPTSSPDWSVADVARHLLGGDLGVLARRRDDHADPGFAAGFDLAAWAGVVDAIDRHNARWTVAARRISPRLTVDLLDVTGEWVAAFWDGCDLSVPGVPVDWATGPEPAPLWLDVAREYTERWTHQAQIRAAVGAEPLDDPRWLAPVIAAFARALPRALAGIEAPEGTVARLRVIGPAGGTFQAVRDGGEWRFAAPDEAPAAAELALDADLAWRLWTRGVTPEAARPNVHLSGDSEMGRAMLGMVAIIVAP